MMSAVDTVDGPITSPLSVLPLHKHPTTEPSTSSGIKRKVAVARKNFVPKPNFYNFSTESVLQALFTKMRQLRYIGDDEIMKPSFTLPSVDDLRTRNDDYNWVIKELQVFKTFLNLTKSDLDHFILATWHAHTKCMNPANDVMSHVRSNFRPEYCSQAWCKFYECLNTFKKIIPNSVVNEYKMLLAKTNKNVTDGETALLTSVHLCEAPGAFISALNHYIFTNYARLSWDWLSTTLSPYWEGNSSFEMINDDLLIRSSINNWCFLSDGTGNLMSRPNIQHLIQQVKNKFGDDGVHLITADGSVDCQMNPCEQESMVVGLHLAEIVTALSVLRIGGSFILKIFTFLEAPTISHLYLLSCLFKQIHLFKPATSKEGNSEVYVICLDYLGATEAQLECLLSHVESNIGNQQGGLFTLKSIPKPFIQRIIEAADFFVKTQITVIEKNMKSFSQSTMYHRLMYEIRCCAANTWMERCRIRPLPFAARVFKNLKNSWIDHVDTREMKYTSHAEEAYKEKTLLQIPYFLLEEIEKDLTPHQQFLSDRFGASHNSQPPVSTCSEYLFATETAVEFNPGIFPLVGTNLVYNKAYKNIQSSRFCSSKLLKQRTRIRSIQKDLLTDFQMPNCKCSNFKGLSEALTSVLNRNVPQTGTDDERATSELLIIQPSDFGSQHSSRKLVIALCFNETLSELIDKTDIETTYSKLQIFLNLLLTRLEPAESFFLCSYPLLTRLHLGVIFCLAQLFQAVYLTEDGIFLNHFKGFVIPNPENSFEKGVQPQPFTELLVNSKPTWELLRQKLAIFPSSLSTSSYSETQILLECLPIQTLCSTIYSNLIYTYNVSLVVHSVEEYMKEIRSILNIEKPPDVQGAGKVGQQEGNDRSGQGHYKERRNNSNYGNVLSTTTMIPGRVGNSSQQQQQFQAIGKRQKTTRSYQT